MNIGPKLSKDFPPSGKGFLDTDILSPGISNRKAKKFIYEPTK